MDVRVGVGAGVGAGAGAMTSPGAVTVMETVLVVVRPAESVTVAEIAWLPAGRRVDTDGPVPRRPTRFDVHWSCGDRSPSCVSLAVPEMGTGLLLSNVAFAVGDEMLTDGAVLVGPDELPRPYRL